MSKARSAWKGMPVLLKLTVREPTARLPRKSVVDNPYSERGESAPWRRTHIDMERASLQRTSSRMEQRITLLAERLWLCAGVGPMSASNERGPPVDSQNVQTMFSNNIYPGLHLAHRDVTTIDVAIGPNGSLPTQAIITALRQTIRAVSVATVSFSAGFRSDRGVQIHAGYRSVNGTGRINGKPAFDAIHDLIDGKFAVA